MSPTMINPTRISTAALAALCLLIALGTGTASATTATTGEILTGNLFLGTTKVEIGVRPNGSFGSDVTPPAGYHPRDDNSPEMLGFRGNPDTCDWNVLSCATQGDFFAPGGPFERWGIQVGTGTFYKNDDFFDDIAGSFTSVDPANSTGTWESTGSTDGISFRMVYSTPSFSWLVNASIQLTNTTASPINDVYYLRMVDPDNCMMETRAICTNDAGVLVGQTYDTLSTIVSTGPGTGVALVTATQTDGTYLGLRVTSASAKAFRHAPGTDGTVSSPAAVWNGTATQTTIAVGASGPDSNTTSGYWDAPIGVVDKIDTIAPGETKTINLQYVLKEGAPTSEPPASTTPAAATATATVTTSTQHKTTTPAVSVRSTTPAGPTIRTTLTVPGAGRLTQTGTRIVAGRRVDACARINRRVTLAGTVTLTCRLTSATQAARRNGPVTVRLTSVYTPAGGKPQKVTRIVRLGAIGPVEPVTG